METRMTGRLPTNLEFVGDPRPRSLHGIDYTATVRPPPTYPPTSCNCHASSSSSSYSLLCEETSIACLLAIQVCLDLAAPVTMESEAEFVKVDGLDFPKVVKPTDGSKPLKLLGHGITDMEIHFLQVKFTAIGIYLDDESVSSHLQNWHGKTADEIIRDESFFNALIHAPVEKFIRIVIIKEIKGAQYGLQLENAVRERLADIDKYEEEEESALEKLVEFFRAKYLKSNTIITFHIPADSCKGVQVGVLAEGKQEENRTTVDNQNVGETIAKWYLGGSSALSPSTISSLVQGVAALLSG